MADLHQEEAVEALVVVAVVAVADVVVSEVSSHTLSLYSIINRIFRILSGGGGYNAGPPERLNVVAEVSHVCEGQIIGMV